MANENDLRRQIDETQRKFEKAATSGDAAALASQFTDDGLYLPHDGGEFRGRDEIKRYFEKAPTPKSYEIRSHFSEPVSDKLVFDIGSARIGLPDEASGETAQVEYVVLAEQIDGEFKLRRVVGFPARGQTQAGR